MEVTKQMWKTSMTKDEKAWLLTDLLWRKSLGLDLCGREINKSAMAEYLCYSKDFGQSENIKFHSDLINLEKGRDVKYLKWMERVPRLLEIWPPEEWVEAREREELRDKALQSSPLFLIRYTPDYLPYRPFHLHYVKKLDEHLMIFYTMPTGTGKSRCMLRRLIRLACKDPDFTAKILAANLRMSMKWVNFIGHTLIDSRNYPLLQADFGVFRPEMQSEFWSSIRLDIRQRTRFNADGTFEGYGYMGFPPGGRADEIDIDDPSRPEKASSVVQNETQIKHFDEVVMMRGIRMQDFAVKGNATVYDFGDLPDTIRNRVQDGIDTRFVYYNQDIFDDETEKRSIWPEQKPMSELKKLQAANPLAFDKTQRNRVYPLEKLVFSIPTLRDKCLKLDLVMGAVPEGWPVFIGVDPSAGRTSRKAGAPGIVVLGLDEKNKKIRVCDLWSEKAHTVFTCDRLFNMWYPYRDRAKVRIEDNIAYGGFSDLIEEKEKELGVMKKVYKWTGGNRLTVEVGITSLLREVDPEMFEIPYGDQASQVKANKFIEQMGKWFPQTTAPTDLVFAFWKAVEEIREYLAANELVTTFYDLPGKWGGQQQGTFRNPAWN